MLLCFDLVGPKGDRTAELEAVTRWAAAKGERFILEKLAQAAKSSTGVALMLASFFEGHDPDALIVQVVARFCCVSWAVLSGRHEIVDGGQRLDGQQAYTELHQLSQQCHVGECDAFFSLSWHDDGCQKWEA